MASNSNLPKHFGVVLFPGFEALDVFGPMEIFNNIPDITFSVIAATLDPVSTRWEGAHSIGQSVVPTHTFADAPALDVLIIPGGWGAFHVAPELLEYVRTAGPKAGHLITVCNGAALAAQTGILDGKSATTNKALWEQCVAFGPKVNWVAQARWVRDGNIWTSSGVSAGIDTALAWVASVYGEEQASQLANGIEFTRAESSSHDPFAAIFQCKDVRAQL